MAAVIKALHEEHRNIARLLNALEHQMEIFAQAGAPDYDVIVGVSDYFLDYPDRCHHPKEDAIFVTLQETHPKDAASIGDLPNGHRILHEQAQRFRDTVKALLSDTDISRAVVVDAALVFIAAERRHMRLEEESIFPLADRLLTPADWQKIGHTLAERSDPVFGVEIEESFRKLSDRLLAWEQEFEQSRAP